MHCYTIHPITTKLSECFLRILKNACLLSLKKSDEILFFNFLFLFFCLVVYHDLTTYVHIIWTRVLTVIFSPVCGFFHLEIQRFLHSEGEHNKGFFKMLIWLKRRFKVEHVNRPTPQTTGCRHLTFFTEDSYTT